MAHKGKNAHFKAPTVGCIFYCQPEHVQMVGIMACYAAVM